MTPKRYAIDAAVAIRLARESARISGDHQLVAPNILRSQALGLVYRSVRRGELTEQEGRAILEGITSLRIRLLGDRVSRATAWKVAQQLDWDDTTNAEYVAVAQLQADAFITLDPDLRRDVDRLVVTAPYEVLLED